MNRIAIVLTLTLIFSCTFSCKKDNEAATVSLPPALAQVHNSTTVCDACPYNISLIVWNSESYYQVELAPEAVLCDAVIGAVIYDANGNMIELNSEKYFNILNNGSDRGIIFSCKKRY